MPYVQATILELLRYKTLFPLEMRSTLQDTEVTGYFVPRGTTVGYRVIINFVTKSYGSHCCLISVVQVPKKLIISICTEPDIDNVT